MNTHSVTLAVRQALLDLLAGGRAITTTELRIRLDGDPRFADLHQEVVYRHLDALARQGRIRRLRHPGRRHSHWYLHTPDTTHDARLAAPMRSTPRPRPRPRAVFSADGRYRYRLSRQWDPTLPVLGVIGLNPSTADQYRDDTTVRRLTDFTAHTFGCGGFNLYNLSAAISTDPRHLRALADPIGPENSTYLRELGYEHDLILLAWGNGADPVRARVVTTGLWRALRRRGGTLATFGFTAAGQPRHPVRLARSCPVVSLTIPTGHNPTQIPNTWAHLIAATTVRTVPHAC